MYVEENTIKRSNPPNERNWLKNLIMTGSIIVGISHLFLMIYSITGIVSLYVDVNNESLVNSIGLIGSSIYSTIIAIGILVISIGFIGISRLVQGSAKIPLIISAVILVFLTFISVIVSALNSIFLLLGLEMLVIGIFGFSFWILKIFLIVLAQFIVSFTKSKLIEGDSTINFRAITAYILPVWLIVIAVTAILYSLNNGIISGLVMYIGFLCLSLNQIIYSIEFSIKVKR